MRRKMAGNQRGVALITALLVSTALLAIVMGIIYFIIQSTTMSGAGKRYATAAEAADGAIELVKDTINVTWWGEAPASILSGAVTACDSGSGAANIGVAIRNQGQECIYSFDLLSTTPGTTYRATITITQLLSSTIPGGRLEFARSAGGAASTVIYYRITSSVTGSNNTRAENSALYRFAG